MREAHPDRGPQVRVTEGPLVPSTRGSEGSEYKRNIRSDHRDASTYLYIFDLSLVSPVQLILSSDSKIIDAYLDESKTLIHHSNPWRRNCLVFLSQLI